jgi:hypothetical protein
MVGENNENTTLSSNSRQEINGLIQKSKEEMESFVIDKLGVTRTDINHTMGIMKENNSASTAAELEEIKEQLARIEQRFEKVEEEKAYRTIVLKNADILVGGDITKKQLIELLESSGVNINNFDEVQVVRMADKPTGLITSTAYFVATSPRTVDIARGQLIEMFKLRNAKKLHYYRQLGDRRVFLSMEDYIPKHRKEEREAIERKGRELKRENKIASWKISLVKSGPPLDPNYFLGLQVKDRKGAQFRPFYLKGGERDPSKKVQDKKLNKGSIQLRDIGPSGRLQNAHCENPYRMQRRGGQRRGEGHNSTQSYNVQTQNRFDLLEDEEYFEERETDRGDETAAEIEEEKINYREVLEFEKQMRQEENFKIADTNDVGPPNISSSPLPTVQNTPGGGSGEGVEGVEEGVDSTTPGRGQVRKMDDRSPLMTYGIFDSCAKKAK